MPKRFRNFLISAVTFIGGLYFFLEYIIPKELYNEEKLGPVHEKILLAVQITGVMAIGLGVINMLRFHLPNIMRSRKGWLNSLALLLGLFMSLGIQSFDFKSAESKNKLVDSISVLPTYIEHLEKNVPDKKLQADKAQLAIDSLQKYRDKKDPFHLLRHAADDAKDQELVNDYLLHLDATVTSAQLWKVALEQNSPEYPQARENFLKNISSLGQSARSLSSARYDKTWVRQAAVILNDGMFAALGSAMFALLAFYIATAAYRAFRIVSLEAGLMMIVAIVVTLGQIPHGPMYISESLPEIRLWLLKNLSTPAFRAIFFGSTIAGLAMAVRMWLSLEKSPLATDEEGSNNG